MHLSKMANGKKISIHAPREGSDPPMVESLLPSLLFLSTLPARGATAQDAEILPGGEISIHAPREGSDLGMAQTSISALISIHAPREGSDADGDAA